MGEGHPPTGKQVRRAPDVVPPSVPHKAHSLAELTADWRARAEVVLGEDVPTWAQQLLDRGATELGCVRTISGWSRSRSSAVVLLSVANRRTTWGRFNLHAETMRQIMGVRFATTDDRLRVLDQIVARTEAESLRLTLGSRNCHTAWSCNGVNDPFDIHGIPGIRWPRTIWAASRRLT